MGDILVLTNWAIFENVAGDNTSWRTRYRSSALPFLTEFNEGTWIPARNAWSEGPAAQSSLQYRDAETGDLLAVHPIADSPFYSPGGPEPERGDLPFTPAVTHNGTVYLNGWLSGALWRMNADGSLVWRTASDDADVYPGGPEPDFFSYGPWSLPSADGNLLYVQQSNGPITPNDALVTLNTADASIASYVVMGAPVEREDIRGMVEHPDGGILAAVGSGVYHIDLDTGTATPFLMTYPGIFGMAAHPGGDGFAMCVQSFTGGTLGYHSQLVEVAWDGTVTNTYDYLASGLDGERRIQFFDVTYSSDGSRLYAVSQALWPVIWRFERGPGSVGGDWFWMNGTYATRDDFIADGSLHTAGANALWGVTIAGVGAYACVPPPNDDVADAEVLVGDNGSASGTTECASLEVGESYSDDATLTVHYVWAATASGQVTWRVDALEATTGSVKLKIVSPYDGAQGTNWGSELSASVESGDVVTIVVASENGDNFNLSWSFDPFCVPPANDNWADARVLVGSSGQVLGDNTCATLEVDEPEPECDCGDGGDGDGGGGGDGDGGDAIMFGAHVDGSGFTEDSWEDTRRQCAVIRTYNSGDWAVPGPTSHTMQALDAGRTVLTSHKSPGGNNAGCQSIAAGSEDAVIDDMVAAYSPYGHRAVFIFFHEPHDNSLNAGDYVAAFRYLSDKMHDAGILVGYCAVGSNAVAGTPDGSGDLYYPGDQYIDVECHDAYTWGWYASSGLDPRANFDDESFESQWTAINAMAIARGHPLVIGEVGCYPFYTTHVSGPLAGKTTPPGTVTRTEWFTAAAYWMKTQDNIRGFCLFESEHVSENGNVHDWRTAAPELTTFITDPYFSGVDQL